MTLLQDQINQAWEQRDTLSPKNTPVAVAQAIDIGPGHAGYRYGPGCATRGRRLDRQ